MKLVRTARGLGIDDLPCAESLIRMMKDWEHGTYRPGWKYQTLLAAAFGLSPRELFGDAAAAIPIGAAVGSTFDLPHFARAEDDRMERRAFVAWLGALAAGTAVLPDATRNLVLSQPTGSDLRHTITLHDAERLRAWHRIYEQEEHSLGGGLSLRAVIAQFSYAADHLKAGVTGTPEALDEWRMATAALGATAAWMSNDIGLHEQARGLHVMSYGIVSTAERHPGADAYRAHLLAQLARQSIDIGRPRTALELVRHAQSIADDSSPTTKTKLHAVKARAFGALGDVQAVRRELGLHDEQFSNASEQDIELEAQVYEWRTPAQRHYNHGTALQLLAGTTSDAISDNELHGAAEQFATSARAWAHGEERTAVSARLRAATLLFRGHEPEAAVAIARDTLGSIPRLRSKRVVDDVDTLTTAAAWWRRKRPDVDALVHELSAATR